jgi:hypothetical protein
MEFCTGCGPGAVVTFAREIRPWKTLYEGHRLWPGDGTWERLLQ